MTQQWDRAPDRESERETQEEKRAAGTIQNRKEHKKKNRGYSQIGLEIE